jgi:hypothetical protein
VNDLVAEAPPRSDATVARWSSPLVARTTALRRNVVAIIVGAGVVTGGAIALAIARAASHDMTPMGGFVMGIVPFVLIAGAYMLFVRSSLAAAPELVRTGVAHPARVTKQVANGPAKRYITVEWQEPAKAAALVQAERLASPVADGDAVTVLVSPRCRSVGVILGDNGLYIADRS